MIRTRDFLLFLLSVSFLLIGIASTISKDVANNKWWNVFGGEVSEIEYTAVLPEEKGDGRQERLLSLRDKLAVIDNIDDNVASVIVASEDLTEESDESETEDDTDKAINICSDVINISHSWSLLGAKMEVVEGARIFYRENTDITQELVTGPYREVIFQLPLRFKPNQKHHCLGFDVVGIASDGSPIKNNESKVYGIFGAETLIGYALDGFPIYGLNDLVETDDCGGVVESGQYRYYISSDRDGMLGCFAGEPISP